MPATIKPLPRSATFRRELPRLLRRQRKLAGVLTPPGEPSLVEQEKAARGQMDALLVGAGFAKNEGVLCLGYEVVHRERNGRSSLNTEVLTEKLVALGLTRAAVDTALADSTTTGDPSTFTSVEPAKGAAVRSPR